jgi:hypothetical protein
LRLSPPTATSSPSTFGNLNFSISVNSIQVA